MSGFSLVLLLILWAHFQKKALSIKFLMQQLEMQFLRPSKMDI